MIRQARVLRALGILGLLGLLAGCAGAPPSLTRYTLPSPATGPATPAAEASRSLVLEPVRIAAFLQADGIVMQMSDIELRQASNHLWAVPLERQLQERLRHGLAMELKETRVVSERVRRAGPGDFRLVLEVDSFQGRYDGIAVVEGEWRLWGTQDQILARGRFSVEEPLAADGYPALVRSLGRAWQSVVRQLAPTIERRLSEAGA